MSLSWLQNWFWFCKNSIWKFHFCLFQIAQVVFVLPNATSAYIKLINYSARTCSNINVQLWPDFVSNFFVLLIGSGNCVIFERSFQHECKVWVRTTVFGTNFCSRIWSIVENARRQVGVKQECYLDWASRQTSPNGQVILRIYSRVLTHRVLRTSAVSL